MHDLKVFCLRTRQKYYLQIEHLKQLLFIFVQFIVQFLNQRYLKYIWARDLQSQSSICDKITILFIN